MSIDKYITKLQNDELLTQRQIKLLCTTTTSILIQQPNVMQRSGDQYVIGDIHGQFYDLKEIVNHIVPDVSSQSYVFLGDYVDRGYNSVETICLLMAYKCLYADHVVLIRGNHETSSLTKIYGFYEEVLKKYGNLEVWKCITNVFMYLPLAATISNHVFCLHGGLSPSTPYIEDIAMIDRVAEIPESGPMSDLVWSDPDNTITSWTISNRGAGYLFPHKAVQQFLFLNNFDTVARAHQLVEQGYVYNFDDQTLATVWSAPNYCYRCGNKASIMKVDENGNKLRKIRLPRTSIINIYCHIFCDEFIRECLTVVLYWYVY